MMTTSSRMLALLALLQKQRTWPGQLLADRLDVTTRTVRRDVDRLRELGYRIDAIKGPDGGYLLEAGSELPPLLFDDEQAIAIAVGLRLVPSSGVDIEDAAVRALATVRQVMPARLRHRLDGLQFVSRSETPRVDPFVLHAVSDAIRTRSIIRFGYGDPSLPRREAEPQGLVARNGRWYLVAWDLGRDDWRIFRLDRLTPRIPLGPTFTPRPVPTGDVASFVAARFKGATDQDRWPCSGQFRISLPVQDVIPWVRDGRIEHVTEEISLVTAESWSWTGLIADILRLDAPFQIVGPAELIRTAEALAIRLNASHDETTPHSGMRGDR